MTKSCLEVIKKWYAFSKEDPRQQAAGDLKYFFSITGSQFWPYSSTNSMDSSISPSLS